MACKMEIRTFQRYLKCAGTLTLLFICTAGDSRSLHNRSDDSFRIDSGNEFRKYISLLLLLFYNAACELSECLVKKKAIGIYIIKSQMT